MKVFKPLQISLLNKCFSWQKKNKFAVTCLIGFDFDDQKEIILEQDLWKLIPDQMGEDLFDIGMPKPQGEVLVYGQYHSPGGKPVPADDASVTLGAVRKSVRVIGNRYWRAIIGPTEPEPFVSLPIRYDYAFGGSAYAKNPAGKGMDEVDYFGEPRLPLPNIETPDNLVTSSSSRPMPAGFAAFRPEWEQRVSLMGTYDENWKNNHFPDLAPDLDWNHFNAAPKDQWINDFWKGDESFEIRNMHPEKPLLSGRLPGFKVKSFVAMKGDDSIQIKQVEMKAETVFLFPEEETGIMLYRGTIQVEEDDASDIDHILCAFESLNESPRSKEYYEAALIDRLDEKQVFKYMLTTKDLIPQSVRCGFAQLLDAADQQGENILVENIKARADLEKENANALLEEQRQALKKQLEDAGIDPAPYLEKLDSKNSAEIEDPALKALMESMEKVLPGCTAEDGRPVDISKFDFTALQKMTEQVEGLAEDKKNEQFEKLREYAAKLEGEAGEQAREKVEEAIKKTEGLQPLPRPSIREILENIDQQLLAFAQSRQLMLEQGIDVENLPSPTITSKEVQEKTQEAINGAKSVYRIGAHYITGTPPHEVPLDIVLHRFKKDMARGASMADGDYSGVDFSGMDLKGINLSGCFLEYANFTATNLSGANLSGAIITHAKLNKANLTDVNLTEANLGGSTLLGAEFIKANLMDAVLSRANCAGAKFIDCNLQGVNFIETKMGNVEFHKCRTHMANFIELEFNGGSVKECDFIECNFVKCVLKDCDCRASNFSSSNFFECHLDGSKFIGAQLKNVRLPGGSTARYCDFNGAMLDQSNFRDVDAIGSYFEKSSLSAADFSGANLQKSHFYAAVAKRTLFVKSDLCEADLSSFNLMEGSLTKARLTNADLSHANLYGVDFMGATIGDTNFSGANLDLTLLEMARP